MRFMRFICITANTPSAYFCGVREEEFLLSDPTFPTSFSSFQKQEFWSLFSIQGERREGGLSLAYEECEWMLSCFLRLKFHLFQKFSHSDSFIPHLTLLVVRSSNCLNLSPRVSFVLSPLSFVLFICCITFDDFIQGWSLIFFFSQMVMVFFLVCLFLLCCILPV